MTHPSASRAAFSARIFAIYVFIIGPVLMIVPNLLLALFGLPPTSEVWIRLIGLLALNIGVFLWVAARHEYTHFLHASVATRCMVFVVIAGFAVLGFAPPVIMVFGVIDLAGGLWTYFALRADATATHARLPA
jgi:hypothetical protein